jgi:hypothetical protein
MRRTDCEELIKGAERGLKRASYQLSNLVTNGEQSVQIFNSIPQTFELLENLPIFFKIISKKEL